MFEKAAWQIKKEIGNRPMVIVGGGTIGRELIAYFVRHNAQIVEIFDNGERLAGKTIHGIAVSAPHMFEDEDIAYIITPDKPFRGELRKQLIALGINPKNIYIYYAYRNDDYKASLPEDAYQDEISEMYRETFGYDMDWKNPKKYNEIVNWEKLNVKDERRTRLADKYLVREWIKEKIGGQYLTKLLGVWDTANEIDFASLPNQFVLKVNNGSCRNIIVKDKKEINEDEVRRQLNAWLHSNFAYESLELHYRDIPPRIICEEYLDGVADAVCEYQVFCFHGSPKYVWCIRGSHREDCRASFYDMDWNKQDFSYGYPYDGIDQPRPPHLEEILELSRILSMEFEHVRVDWNDIPDGRVLFGEMTFSTWSGLRHFVPESYDEVFGELVRKK